MSFLLRELSNFHHLNCRVLLRSYSLFIFIYNFYLPSAMFIAQVLVGPSIKHHKEIIQIENNMVKNPNWQEADQMTIYKRRRGVELGATEKQLQLAVRAGLEPGTSGFQVWRPNHSTTLPPLFRFTTSNRFVFFLKMTY